MPEIVVHVVIKAPAVDVFEYATTPENWPKFWPVTRRVEGQTKVSPPIGAKWTEFVKIGFWEVLS